MMREVDKSGKRVSMLMSERKSKIILNKFQFSRNEIRKFDQMEDRPRTGGVLNSALLFKKRTDSGDSTDGKLTWKANLARTTNKTKCGSGQNNKQKRTQLDNK